MTSIPAFHVSTKGKAEGTATVLIPCRKDSVSSGTFSLTVFIQFDPTVDPYPNGSLKLKTDLSDSLKSTFIATSMELVNSYGKHSPTIYVTGQCKSSAGVKGLRYWLTITDNGAAVNESLAGFAIHDNTGKRVAYAMGAITKGNIKVDPS